MLGTTSLAGLIPPLRKPLSDPLERFSLYDCPTGDDVVRSAHLAASTRGIDNAFGHRPLIPNATSIPGLIPEFGGHPHTRPKHPLPASLALIARPHAASSKATRTQPPPPTFRALCGLSPRPPKPARTRAPLDPTAAEEDDDAAAEVRAALAGAARAHARAQHPAHLNPSDHPSAPVSVVLEEQPDLDDEGGGDDLTPYPEHPPPRSPRTSSKSSP